MKHSVIPCCLYLLLTVAAIQQSLSWEFTLQPKSKPKPRAPVQKRGNWHVDSKKQSKRQLSVQQTIQTVEKFATDAGVLTAVGFLGGEYLARQPGQVGLVFARVGRLLQGFTKFPGVAFTLCFLSAIPLPQGHDFAGWTMFRKSYVVYLFRFLRMDDTSFIPYAAEGALGILAAIKLLHHFM